MRLAPPSILVCVGLLACGGADTDTDPGPDTDIRPIVSPYQPPQACPGATTLRVDYPEHLYNTYPRSLVNFGGRLWVTANGVDREETSAQPGLWAPLDCTGEEPPAWRYGHPVEGRSTVNLVARDERMLVGVGQGSSMQVWLVDPGGDPLGAPVELGSRYAFMEAWGLTEDGFFVPHDIVDDDLRLRLLDRDGQPVDLRILPDVPRQGGVRALGPPTEPKVAAVDDDTGTLVVAGLDGSRSDIDLPLGAVSLARTDPRSAWMLRQELDADRTVLTDGVNERELFLPRKDYLPTLAQEGQGFWIGNGPDVYWLSSWDGEPELVGSSSEPLRVAGMMTSVGEGRVAVLFNTWDDWGATSVVEIFER